MALYRNKNNLVGFNKSITHGQIFCLENLNLFRALSLWCVVQKKMPVIAILKRSFSKIPNLGYLK